MKSTKAAAVISMLSFALTVAPSALASVSGQAAGLAGIAALAAPAEQGELPVRNIILYRSGVGYFQREGHVTGDTKVSLGFDTEQVSDILKSLIVLDLDGGRIGGATYGSKEPLERRLRSFGVNIADAPNIAALFTQLRGSKVRVIAPEGSIEGTILGVESRPTAVTRGEGGEGGIIQQSFVNLVTTTGVRSVAIPSISSFALSDPTLNEELNKALAALAEQRMERLTTIDLSLSAKAGDAAKSRRIVVAYVHEMPVWKTSYRLVLPDDAPANRADKQGDGLGAAGNSKLTLQGWAIVENTTDQDWEGVELSVASGRPVSFTMDLYQPIFAPRPALPVPVFGGLLSRAYETGRRLAAGKEAAAAPADSRLLDQMLNQGQGLQSVRGSIFREQGTAGADEERAEKATHEYLPSDMVSAAAQAQAAGVEAGSQFLYTIESPVSLERQRSAMLPILTAPVEGRRVSVFSAAEGLKSPMRAVEFKNTSGLHLMPGPLSVYDGATYAGDAQIAHTSRNETRLLSYALDIDVRAQTELQSNQNLMRLSIVDGAVRKSWKQMQGAKYSFTSFDPTRDRTVIVEHPKSQGWDLVGAIKPTEVTEALYRFELPVAAGKEASLDVSMERTVFESVAVTSLDLPTILAFAKDNKCSQAMVDAVKKAGALQSTINDLSRQIQERESERGTIRSDQDRLRQNMHTVDRNSELWRRYYGKLEQQETRLETIEEAIKAAQASREQTQRELNDYLRNLSVE